MDAAAAQHKLIPVPPPVKVKSTALTPLPVLPKERVRIGNKEISIHDAHRQATCDKVVFFKHVAGTLSHGI